MRRRNELDRCRRGERSGIEFAFVKRVVFQRSRNGLLRRRIPVISLRIPFHRDELHRAVLRLEAYRCRKPQICELRSHVLVRDGDCVVHLRQRELDCLNGKRRSCFGIEQAIFRLEDHGYFLRARFAVERFRLPVGELEGECTGKLGIRALNSGLAAGQRAGLTIIGSDCEFLVHKDGVFRKLERAAIVQSFCPLEGRKLCDFRLSLYGRLHLDHKLDPNIRALRERDIVLPIRPVKCAVLQSSIRQSSRFFIVSFLSSRALPYPAKEHVKGALHVDIIHMQGSTPLASYSRPGWVRSLRENS